MLDAFVAQAVSRAGHGRASPVAHLSVGDHESGGLDVARMRADFEALAEDPLLRKLMEIEASLAREARARSGPGHRLGFISRAAPVFGAGLVEHESGLRP